MTDHIVSEEVLREVLANLPTVRCASYEQILSILASPPAEPVAWEMWKDGKKCVVKHANDSPRGEQNVWHPLFRKDL